MELITEISHPLFKTVSSNHFPIFFSIAYYQFLKSQNSQLALIYDDEINAVMPVKLWNSKVLNYVTCLHSPLRAGETLEVSSEKLFLDKFIQLIQSKKIADRISAPENFAIFQVAPSESISIPFGTYKVVLQLNSFSQVFSSFQARYRSAINNAKKQGIEIRYGQVVLNDFYHLHQITMRRSKMYVHDKSYFENYFDAMPSHTYLAVAYYRNEAIGALLNIYNQYAAYYLYGCSSNNTYASGAIKYLHSDAMEKLIAQKVNYYDFVGARLSDVSGTKLQGIQDFKSRFGSKLFKGLIWKQDINKFKCRTADQLLKLKMKLKGAEKPKDIIDQELGKC
jgi:FemAB family